VNGRVTDDIGVPVAIEEGKYVIAQANAALDKKGKCSTSWCPAAITTNSRWRRSTASSTWPLRLRIIVSVAASLMPVLEHDDANRALMGSNMHAPGCSLPARGRSPWSALASNAPWPWDSGTAVPAVRGGVVDYVDASRIVVRVNDEETTAGRSAWISTIW